MKQIRGQTLQPQRSALQSLRQSSRHARHCRAATPQVRAGLVLPKNPIGIHSGVFVGDWKPQDAERAVKGAKEAGYDLIERMAFQIHRPKNRITQMMHQEYF